MCKGELLGEQVKNLVCERGMHMNIGEWRCFLNSLQEFVDEHENQLNETIDEEIANTLMKG